MLPETVSCDLGVPETETGPKRWHGIDVDWGEWNEDDRPWGVDGVGGRHVRFTCDGDRGA